MSFGSPQLLWLLLALPPALVVFFWWSWKKRRRLAALFIQARLLSALTRGISPARQKLRLGCLVLAVVGLLLALAQPQWGFSWQEVKQRGVDIIVAIDCSKSMLAQDVVPSRLARAKLAAMELMQKARTDRLGVVAFAGSAFLQCPLTIDDAAFAQSVDSLDVSTVSQGGTAIAEAIDTASAAFKEGENHKVLVLMTDGEDQDSGALPAAQKAAQAGMRIFTIGIGTPEGQLIRVKNEQGKEDFVRDEDGNVHKSHLDETLLKQIAGATEGGFYLPLKGARTIDTLYEKGLAELPKSEHQEKFVKQYHERFQWPLGAAILLLMAEMLIPERRREHAPRRSPVRLPTKVAKAAAAILVLLALGNSGFAATPGKALRDYKAGKYDESLKEYEQLLQRKADDPRLHFNAGAAAYRNRQFDEARKQFDDALASPDLKLQELAYYNRGNSLFYLGEQNPDPKKRTEAWEKALSDFDLSLKLNPQDADAKFNKDFVKRKLEELKQQQQQQQNSKQDKSDQQDQNKNQQSQNSKQDQKQQQDQNQQQQQQSQQNQSQQQQDSQQNQQQQQQQQNQQQAAQNQMGQTNQQQQAAPQQNPEEDPSKREQQEAAAAGQMTREQAERLLDAQKGQEKVLSLKGQPKPSTRRLKDW